jgi:hypothetical protein
MNAKSQFPSSGPPHLARVQAANDQITRLRADAGTQIASMVEFMREADAEHRTKVLCDFSNFWYCAMGSDDCGYERNHGDPMICNSLREPFYLSARCSLLSLSLRCSLSLLSAIY